jgi:PAS domain S-box-containing protein
MWTIVADISARKQAEATLQQHARRLELLRKVDQAILSAQSPEVIAQSVVDQLQDLTSADRTNVVQFNFAVGEAIVIATQGEVPTELSKTRCLPLARYGPLAEYRSGQVHSVDDISDLPQPTPLEQTLQAEGVRAYLGVPLVEMDELLGLLILAWTQPGPVPAEHVEIAREVANRLAVVICQARLREQVEGHAEELEQQVAERTAELHRERKFVSAILDTTGVLVVVLDTGGRIIGFNRACEQNSGYSFGEVQDQQFGDILLSPEVGAQLRPVFEKVQAGIYPQQFEGVWNTKDGRQRLISWSYNALIDQADVVEFIIGIGLDITERVQAEKENWQLYEALSLQHEQLRALTRQLADVQEVERQHISRQLHDRVGQRLSAIGFNLKFIETQISDAVPAAEPIQNRLADSLELVAETTNRIRELMAELRPPLLDDYGLAEALTWYADQFTARSEVRTEVQLQPLEPRLPASVENTLFRIAQEALTNVAKHARATTATISLQTDGQSVRLVIADDGVGFDPDHTASATNRQTWGFLTMTERAEMVGGLCRIESQSGRGTRVVVEVDRPQDVGGEQ